MLPALALSQASGLPQLAAILDEEQMRGAFADALRDNEPAANLAVTDCRTQWIKYKPGKNCTVCYRLAIADPRRESQAEQLVYGRIYADGDARGRFVKTQPAKLTRPAYGRAMMYLSQFAMLAWFFPNDHKLSGLPALLDNRGLINGSLGMAIKTLCGSGWSVDVIKPEVIHYVPEHTCTMRVEVTAKHAGNGAARDLTLFGKSYCDDTGAETYRLMRELWRRSEQDSSSPKIAQPCSYDPEHKILWQVRVTGATLLQQELASQRFLAALPAAAAAVAALHRTPLQCSRQVALGDCLHKLGEMRAFLPQLLPASDKRVTGLIDHLLQSAARLRGLPNATLHGDLHLGNIMTENGKAALIDLDGLAEGPALMDIGSLIAALIFQSMIQRVDQPSLDAMVEALVRQYRSRIHFPVEPFDLRWHTATALIVERAYRCVARLKAGRVELVDEVIDAACAIGFSETGWGRWRCNI